MTLFLSGRREEAEHEDSVTDWNKQIVTEKEKWNRLFFFFFFLKVWCDEEKEDHLLAFTACLNCKTLNQGPLWTRRDTTRSSGRVCECECPAVLKTFRQILLLQTQSNYLAACEACAVCCKKKRYQDVDFWPKIDMTGENPLRTGPNRSNPLPAVVQAYLITSKNIQTWGKKNKLGYMTLNAKQPAGSFAGKTMIRPRKKDSVWCLFFLPVVQNCRKLKSPPLSHSAPTTKKEKHKMRHELHVTVSHIPYWPG